MNFYIGLGQIADPLNPYYPVGIQYETEHPRPNAYYRDSIGGMNLMDMPSPGRLMIRADLAPGSAVPVIEGDLSLCVGETNALTIASASQRFATQVNDFSSQVSSQTFSANQTLGAPDVYPNYEASSLAWVSATPDGQREFIELKFSGSAPINYVDIYETFNPGAVDTVYVKNPGTNIFEVVYTETAAAASKVARVNRINFALTSFNVSEIRIALASDSIPGFHSIDAVAIGERTSPGSFATYLWSPNGETTNGINVTSAGEYSVVVTETGGCESSTSVTVTSLALVTPVISVAAGDNTTFCDGDSVTLISDQIEGNIWSTGATTQSIKVFTSESVTVQYDDGAGCGLTESAPVDVVVNLPPTPAISGSLGICPSGFTTLDAGAGYSSYQWSTGAISQMISVSQADVFEVEVMDGNGCSGSASVTTNFLTPPIPSISGNLSFCPGGSTILDAGTGYNSYSWSTGASSQTITVSTATTVSVLVTDANGCSGSASASTSIYSAPTPSIAGDLDFCLGEFTQLDAGSYASYLWSTLATTQTINATASGPYSVTVTDVNGCSGETDVTVVVNIPPTPVITGSFSFCGGSSTKLDAGAGYNTYLWSTGDISQQITVLDTTTYSVTVTDANNCVGVASATTTIEGSIPESPGPISGPTDGLCNVSNIFYTIDPVPNAAFYVWTVPDSVTILSGQGTTEILVNVGDGFASGDIIVAASNACGQSPSIDPTFITIHTGPNAVVSINGNTSGLCNMGIENYSVDPVVGATSYSWSVPSGSMIVSGQGSSSIDVMLGGAGDICVEVINPCGTSPLACLQVTLNDFEVDAGNCQPVVAGISPLNCADLEVVTIGGTPPFSYSWMETNGTAAGNTQAITVCPMVSTTYMVTVIDADGCIATGNVDVIAVSSGCSGNKIMVCHVASNKTKCYNPNAAASHLAHGDYLGACGSPDPCSESTTFDNSTVVADKMMEMPLSREAAKPKANRGLLIYPNPSSVEITLEFQANKGTVVVVEVRDPFQQLMKSTRFIGQSENEVVIDIADLSAGLYLVSVKQGDLYMTKKLIVHRN